MLANSLCTAPHTADSSDKAIFGGIRTMHFGHVLREGT